MRVGGVAMMGWRVGGGWGVRVSELFCFDFQISSTDLFKNHNCVYSLLYFFLDIVTFSFQFEQLTIYFQIAENAVN